MKLSCYQRGLLREISEGKSYFSSTQEDGPNLSDEEFQLEAQALIYLREKGFIEAREQKGIDFRGMQIIVGLISVALKYPGTEALKQEPEEKDVYKEILQVLRPEDWTDSRQIMKKLKLDTNDVAYYLENMRDEGFVKLVESRGFSYEGKFYMAIIEPRGGRLLKGKSINSSSSDYQELPLSQVITNNLHAAPNSIINFTGSGNINAANNQSISMPDVNQQAILT